MRKETIFAATLAAALVFATLVSAREAEEEEEDFPYLSMQMTEKVRVLLRLRALDLSEMRYESL